MDKHLNFLEDWEKYKIISSEFKVIYCKMFLTRWDFVVSNLKGLYDNWRYGNFDHQFHTCSFIPHTTGVYFRIDDNFLVLLCNDISFMIFDRHTMELKCVSICVYKELHINRKLSNNNLIDTGNNCRWGWFHLFQYE